MNDIKVTIKRSIFPLTKFYLIIGDDAYSISPRELKKIKLYKEGNYEIIASSYWIRKKVKLFLRSQSTISIRHVIPDAYYLYGSPIVIFLSVLSFLGFVNISFSSGCVLIYLLPIIYFTFLKSKDYFKIEVKDEI